MRDLTVATWNTARRAKPEMLDLLAREEVQPDVLFLQEVSENAWAAYAGLRGLTGRAFGVDHRPRAVGEGRKRALARGFHRLALSGPCS